MEVAVLEARNRLAAETEAHNLATSRLSKESEDQLLRLDHLSEENQVLKQQLREMDAEHKAECDQLKNNLAEELSQNLEKQRAKDQADRAFTEEKRASILQQGKEIVALRNRVNKLTAIIKKVDDILKRLPVPVIL